MKNAQLSTIDKMNFNASETFKIKDGEKNLKLKISYNESIIFFEAEEEDIFQINSFETFKCLDELIKINRYFKQYDDLKEVFDSIKMLISNKFLSIAKEEKELKLKIKRPLTNEEFIIQLSKKEKDIKSQMDSLIPYVSSLNNKIINLENQINQIKIDFDTKLKEMEKKYIEELNKRVVNINNNNNNGCFSGNGKVKLADKSFKTIKELVKGDILENGSIVHCLIIQKVNRIIPVIELNDVYFSLKHPVMYKGNWTYPFQIKSSKNVFIDNWYNLVLKNGYSVKINGIEAITLGHMQKDKNAYHPYFGTNMVLKALKEYKGFKDGKIMIEKKLDVKRDENGRTCKYY